MKARVIKAMLLLGVVMMVVTSCGNDDNGVLSPKSIVGEWETSHHSKNPQSVDTADMWRFSFYPDGTGKGPFVRETFLYEINGDIITLTLQNVVAYYGQTVFRFRLVSFTNERMEWDELPRRADIDKGQFLRFRRLK